MKKLIVIFSFILVASIAESQGTKTVTFTIDGNKYSYLGVFAQSYDSEYECYFAAECDNGWCYYNVEGCVTFVGRNSNSYVRDFEIPDKVETGWLLYNEETGEDEVEYLYVTSIAPNAFYDEKDLQSVIIPETVTSIGDRAFAVSEEYKPYKNEHFNITIPPNVKSIGNHLFWNRIMTTFPEVDNLNVADVCNYFEMDGILCHIINENEAEVINVDWDTPLPLPDTITFGGKQFKLVLLQEKDLEIEMNEEPYVIKDGVIYHIVNETEAEIITCDYKVRDIKEMYEGFYYPYSGNILFADTITYSDKKYAVTKTESYKGSSAFENCLSITLPQTLTYIGYCAFLNCKKLTSIVIPSNVTYVGSQAFDNCNKIATVTCLAITPPEAHGDSFENYSGTLYIPCSKFNEYDYAAGWGSFKHVECIGSENIELEKDEVVVEPEINEAVFSMPTNASANSYTLTIQNNGVTFCTLTFNNQGQLANIDFSNSQLKAAVEGYQFTVTGLSAATGYNYSFKALDKNKSVLKEYTGSFTTKNADGTGGSTTTAIENVELANAISIVNNQIFINGEAPAFVITSLGQKIANQNLKAGIYFVVVEGQNVSISIQ